jgi:hypothetical protein
MWHPTFEMQPQILRLPFGFAQDDSAFLIYCPSIWVQLVPPVGSNLMMPFWSLQ